MLKCEIDKGTSRIEVESSVVDLSFEITVLIRDVIESLTAKDETSGKALLEFCKTVLPNIIDPKIGNDDIGKVIDEDIQRRKREALTKALADEFLKFLNDEEEK